MVSEKIKEALILLHKKHHEERENIDRLLSEAINELNGLKNEIELDPNGMYLVGLDIEEGLYKVFPIRKQGGNAPKFEIRKDAKFNNQSKINEEYVNGQMYIELKNGTFIKLTKCKLCKIDFSENQN